MKATFGALVMLILAACDKAPELTEADENVTVIDMASPAYRNASEDQTATALAPSVTPSKQGNGELQASIRVVEGAPVQTVYLIPMGDQSQRDTLADMLRKSGTDCNTVSRIYKLRQEDGEPLDMFKVDCDTGSYQVTIINDKSFTKEWTGNLIGR